MYEVLIRCVNIDNKNDDYGNNDDNNNSNNNNTNSSHTTSISKSNSISSTRALGIIGNARSLRDISSLLSIQLIYVELSVGLRP